MEENKFCYKYPHPSVTTDCVIFGFDGTKLRVLLVQRGIEPYKGRWAFPGGFMKIDESAEQCALRELREETGLEAAYVRQFHAFTAVDRDPRERVVTIAFYALVRLQDVKGGDDAADARWFALDEIPHLAFDHNEIISSAVDCFARMTYFNHEYLFKLLPRKFTITQLRKLYEIVLRTKMDPGNFYKKVALMPYVVPLEEKQLGGRHRAARHYKYDNKAYKKGKL